MARAGIDAAGVAETIAVLPVPERAPPPLDLDALHFRPPDFLRMLDGQDLVGTWTWTFATNEHAWSGGLYRLLGLAPADLQPSYELFLNLVHPEDRARLPATAEIRQGQGGEADVRVIRADGTLRILAVRLEIGNRASGRPWNAVATLLDVTERAALQRVLDLDGQRQRAILERHRIMRFAGISTGRLVVTPDPSPFFGLPSDVYAADNYIAIVAEERERVRAAARETFGAGRLGFTLPALRLADGEVVRYLSYTVPVRNAAGAILEWCGIASPLAGTQPAPTDGFLRGVEQAVQGHHLRAARALLDWTMTNLAEASGLSFSTIRRLEENAEAPNARSRHKAVASLRAAGVRFTLLGQGAVAVSRR